MEGVRVALDSQRVASWMMRRVRERSNDVHSSKVLRIFRQSPDVATRFPLADYMGALAAMLHAVDDGEVEMFAAVALVYFDRVTRDYAVTIEHVRRLVVACAIVAIKYHADEYVVTNTYLASEIGLTARDVTNLERGLVAALDFYLYVNRDEIQAWLQDALAPP
jgi:hypothetical protein